MKIFYLAKGQHGYYFHPLDNVTERGKTYRTKDHMYRVLKKDDPLVFTDGVKAAKRFCELQDKAIERLKKEIASLEKSRDRVAQALEMALAATA